MRHVQYDIDRYYNQRDELFNQRWELGASLYAAYLSQLNATITGYELLICTSFRESLGTIFPQSEASVFDLPPDPKPDVQRWKPAHPL